MNLLRHKHVNKLRAVTLPPKSLKIFSDFYCIEFHFNDKAHVWWSLIFTHSDSLPKLATDPSKEWRKQDSALISFH